LPRHALLFPAEAGGAADLELSAVDRRVLGVRLHVHLGRPASPSLQRDPRVGAVARRRHEPDPARAVVGDDDQRRDGGGRGVAEAQDRSRGEVRRAVARVLRARDVRGADDGDPQRECAVALHRMDDRPCAFRRTRLERTDYVRHILLHGAAARRTSAVEREARERALLARARGRHALRDRDVGRGRLSRAAVALARRARRGALRLRRRDGSDGAVLRAPARRRRAVSRGRRADGGEPVADDGRSRDGARRAPDRRARRGAGRMTLLDLHKRIERSSGLLIFGILVVASIGGLVQIVPSLYQESLSTPTEGVVPYAPLELLGRDIYIRESCSSCHSQQIRPLLAEVQRYGPYSRADEFVYDRPFL